MDGFKVIDVGIYALERVRLDEVLEKKGNLGVMKSQRLRQRGVAPSVDEIAKLSQAIFSYT